MRASSIGDSTPSSRLISSPTARSIRTVSCTSRASASSAVCLPGAMRLLTHCSRSRYSWIMVAIRPTSCIAACGPVLRSSSRCARCAPTVITTIRAAASALSTSRPMAAASRSRPTPAPGPIGSARTVRSSSRSPTGTGALSIRLSVNAAWTRSRTCTPRECSGSSLSRVRPRPSSRPPRPSRRSPPSSPCARPCNAPAISHTRCRGPPYRGWHSWLSPPTSSSSSAARRVPPSSRAIRGSPIGDGTR
jgi:hypothetical protein